MSEPLEDIDETTAAENKSDLVKVSGSILGDINIKLAIVVFITGMLVFSDLFIDNFLSKINRAVDGENATTKGTIIQLTVLVIIMIIVDLLTKHDII